MTRFLLRRVAQAVPLALAVASLVVSLIHLIPGDPAEAIDHHRDDLLVARPTF